MDVASWAGGLPTLFAVFLFSCGPAHKKPVAGGIDMNPEMQSQLIGHWIHSHEEDSSNQLVFRHPDHAFPPSRGRAEYRLDSGGMLLNTRPGPTDRRESAEGSWSLEEDATLLLQPAGQSPQRFRVVSIEPDKLVLSPR